MKKEFCTYEKSLALNELGFDNDECLFTYKNELFDIPVGAPLIQQAFRFFREKYGLYHSVEYNSNQKKWVARWGNIDGSCGAIIATQTYEEAEQACLDKLISLAKDSKRLV